MVVPAAAPSPASSPEPNLYQLQGAQHHITYSTTGFDGKPHFTYQDAAQALHFTGDQIRTAASEIGTLVSVTIHLTVDAGSTTFTLVVPAVRLGQSQQVAIQTLGITTLHRFSIVPQLLHGQTETSTAISLTGTAEVVAF
jgi:hypothetical protein